IGNLEKNVLWSVKEKQGYNAFGLNLVTGADFYFTDAMYLGFEAGFGFGKTNITDYTLEISDLVAFNLATGQASTADAPVAIVGDVDTGHLGMREIGNNYQASLRVGFLIR
ncbi:MAG: putative OmpA-OmpF-like porin family, partial [Bacteroidota bacterium]